VIEAEETAVVWARTHKFSFYALLIVAQSARCAIRSRALQQGWALCGLRIEILLGRCYGGRVLVRRQVPLLLSRDDEILYLQQIDLRCLHAIRQPLHLARDIAHQPAQIDVAAVDRRLAREP
jgi:hypothetical protein